MNLEKYDCFLLDLDGVLLRSSKLIKGAKKSLNELKKRGKVVILSNNSTRSRKGMENRLQKAGLNIKKNEIVNSSYITARYLKNQYGPSKVYAIGEGGLEEELKLANHSVVEPEKANFLIVGMDRFFDYQKLNDGLQCMLTGARFFATNTDPTYPTKDGQLPGAGSMVGAVKGLGFYPQKVLGKPSASSVDIAMDFAGETNKERCLLIGDRLETDILAAENAGIDSLLVLTGITTRGDVSNSKIKPTYVKESLSLLH